MTRKMLVIDTETGGLDPSVHAILSLAAVVYDNGSIADTIHMFIDDTEGLRDPEAMAKNKIDLTSVPLLSPVSAVLALENFLLRNDMRSKVVLVGHNLPFDVGFVKRLYRLAGKNYDTVFAHGGLCTKTGAIMLMEAGRINSTSSSLIHAGPAVGVPVEEKHDALYDAVATAKVLRRMLDLIRNPNWPVHPAGETR